MPECARNGRANRGVEWCHVTSMTHLLCDVTAANLKWARTKESNYHDSYSTATVCKLYVDSSQCSQTDVACCRCF